MTMTHAIPNNWPDPDRPGVPPNPEQERKHWLLHTGRTEPDIFAWIGEDWVCLEYGNEGIVQLSLVTKLYAYVAPCLTPAEHAASIEAATRAGIEAAASLADEQARPGKHDNMGSHEELLRADGRQSGAEDLAAEIRALQPATPALDALIAEAVAEEREACADAAFEAWMDGVPYAEAPAAIRARGEV